MSRTVEEHGRVRARGGQQRSAGRSERKEEVFQFFFDDKPIYAVANTFAYTPAMILFSNAVAPFAGKTDGDVEGAETSIGRIRVFENVG
jgi:hypothetical protein